MKWIFLFIIMIVMGTGGWWWLGHPEPVPDVRPLALEYLNTKPSIVSNGRAFSWDTFWGQTKLGAFADLIPNQSWYVSEPSLVYPIGTKTYVVRWEGVPGCFRVAPAELGHTPQLQDSHGNACSTWWQVEVKVDLNSNKRVLSIQENRETLDYL